MQDAEFIAKHAAMVRRIADQTRAQLGANCDLEDLVSCGFQGLLEARERFDPERGVRFQTFAYYRVRGAIIDCVRSMAYLPRRAYARLRAVEALDAESEQLQEASAAPTSDHAPGTEATLRAIDAVLGRVAAAYCVAHGIDEQSETDASPEEIVLRRERAANVQRALEVLSDKERHLVVGHDMQGRRLDEVGAELGMSKSWASRMHSRALDKLRRRLQRT